MPGKIKILITTAFALCLGITQALAADFTGRWEGRWGGKGSFSSLTVSGPDAADVQYCWNGFCYATALDTMHDVRIEDTTLHADLGRATLAFTLDGETLKGDYAHENGNTAKIEMERAEGEPPIAHTMADFVGKWTGVWDGAGRGTLTVTEGDPFKIKFCYAGNCRSKSLKNIRIGEGDLWFDWSGTMQFSVEGDTLRSTYTNRRGFYTTTMTRKAP